MAHFYAEVTGGRKMASRTGTKNSGLWAHLRGWNSGVKVEVAHIDGQDVYRVYRTSGSNGKGSDKLIAELQEQDI